ncbi:hypothetical protein [Clavibacter nebraskensis]|uniref:Integral membrane protein n=2 Tax=Clavibacter nebraskensis TaxID=31963 RepID=A0ABY4MSY9_9MICO|nr:hypothetical protein [Clavibacter nebraskensis]KXU21451.1 hypothetical protein VV38_03245 [Clavibacter nebraskensis]OAH19206.1 hypothetical protein A3Q38_09005 [Clavibacter nebraskensis]QGV65993.1 hypothetical protein EGX36_03580 [Clavibacter nebraskensis]QGV68790.1 hypothetical protein EGX37_03565 [Clavibacter nebraskensis]QGV71580.1 hypothetical protein EGX35_03565 [Clavibacter nebraskensis]
MTDDRRDDLPASGVDGTGGDLDARHGGSCPVLRELPVRALDDRRFRIHVAWTMASTAAYAALVVVIALVTPLMLSVPVAILVPMLLVALLVVLAGVDEAFRGASGAISRGLGQLVPALCGSFLGGLASSAIPVPGLLVVAGLALGAGFGVGMTRGR